MTPACVNCAHTLSEHDSAVGYCKIEECSCEMFKVSDLALDTLKQTTYDIIDNPEHYTNSRIETWDFIVDKQLPYLTGQVIRYIVRAGRKDPTKYVEDLEKARAYLDREIKRAETGM